MRVMPRFVASTSTGDIGDSSARFRNEKHSMSNMWTSSMKRTPGTISALPSSRHSATLWSICSRISALISPVSPAKRARKPCARELITSISCSETTCTISLRFCSSPSGHCTSFVEAPMASYSRARVNERPNLVIFPEALSMVMTSPLCTFSFWSASTNLLPISYTVSISVVFMVSFPRFSAEALAALSICSSTTSPSMISVSSLTRTPIERRKACVRASVRLISKE
mmetsp:Transcript_67398/g.158967  ORF Transcript_67398/g.158967 Transcript_67398/m.158967 type:complete len:227 (-) Transcript_67398:343-1023(-)